MRWSSQAPGATDESQYEYLCGLPCSFLQLAPPILFANRFMSAGPPIRCNLHAWPQDAHRGARCEAMSHAYGMVQTRDGVCFDLFQALSHAAEPRDRVNVPCVRFTEV